MANKSIKEILSHLVDLQTEQNQKLDKLNALLLSNQLLTECVDHNGHGRDADTVGELVAESFSAGLCLLGELENRNKQYQYQMSEFFIEPDEEEKDQGPDKLTSF